MDTWMSLLGSNGYLPHGYCFTWTPALLWSMVTADSLIAVSYFSIPFAIAAFVRKRPEKNLTRAAWLFGSFIFACGITHVMDVWTIWSPAYGVQTITKMVTAGLSVLTAFSLWQLVPRALKIPSAMELQKVITRLEAEVNRRHSAEDQLAAIQQSLAVTLESIDAGFIATDRKGRVTLMNAVAEGVTGWRQGQAVGQPLTEIYRTTGLPDPDDARNPVDVLLERGTTVESVHHVAAISRTGLQTPLEVKSAVTRDEQGVATGLAMVLRDISFEQRAENEMRESAERLGFILESARIGDWDFDVSTGSMRRSLRHDQCFGFSVAQEHWDLERTVALIHPEDRADAGLTLYGAIRDLKDFQLECRVVWPDASVHWLSAHGNIQQRDGKPTRMLGIVQDITDQKNEEKARLQAQRLEAENHKIQEANRLKSQFLANMSHELRTPLNAVIGFTELLESGLVRPDSPKYPEYLGHIGSSGRHLLQLINDVLDLSKVESGKFEFHPVQVDLPTMVKEVTDVLNTAMQKKAIDLTTALDPAIELHLDPSRLRQVLYNFLSNAIKFTPAGGQVDIRTLAEGPDHFRLEVQDTGIGIAPDDISRLFQEFQQLDSGLSKRYEGTGLGLALTRRLVEAQGGTVGVRSALGKGSLFYLRLNRIHGRDAASADAARPVPDAPSSTPEPKALT